jgi:RNA polymerase sigma factor for flagellar operon FliA
MPAPAPAVAPQSAAAPKSAAAIARQRPWSRAARDELIVKHLPLVRAIASRVREGLPVQVELDDLIHNGILGLVDAISKYNPEKNVVFHLYAKHRIRGAILDSLRQLDWASRDLRKRFKSIESLTQKLGQDLGRPPTQAEIASAMGVSRDHFRRLTNELYNAGLTGGQPHRVERPDHTSFAEATEAPDHQPDELLAQSELRSALDRVIHTLPARYQKVVRMYYDQDRTMKQIGTALGVNESRVSQIHKASLEKLAVALRSNGFASAEVFLSEA